ncbi:MAG: hypothetical protein A3E61_00135 [Candidatus Colwellbacteria bacterium RIFCSPHIGHO2_12_FULL_43_12]|uniref:DUF5666 domain-containing protein n=3 Tax=Candidatus Colwelliibacteriota TaxID=1817904 RepID=A0A1G1Z0C5_9BACT|nr:MAG: hypothetical protein A3D47_02105 [Candidatus Colwellbacteria bacterium RIFCSPHIGHO2_02_FULL_43_15]OGY58407.1 MAG: hypothetical protein A3E61_00135 [Candidatus Colwellbacteria bacterium RIFCSPHIGHO2_12_FULL_43_12]OGY61826.1 MAG: hypothetical protein A3F99_02145 [Candidatus Colwellbacteria bacterium RIFCSPLOWO2_12_FULL_43_11]
MNNNKTLYYIVGVVLVVVAAAGGYFYGYMVGQKSSETEIANLKSSLATYFPPPPEEVFSLSGTVKDIGKDFIEIEIISFVQFPPQPGATTPTEVRTVRVGPETQITEFTFERTAPPVPTGGSVLPQEVPEKKIEFSDLKVGDQVKVEAAQNIKSETEFTATKVQKIPTTAFSAPVTETKTPSL